LARDKALPADFLMSLGLENRPPRGVQVTYRMRDGTLAPRQRIRTALVAKKGSFWTKGVGVIVPYGLWRLEEARKAGFLVLVEGESDC
jgi:putative DNA primase/helicase